MKLSLVDRIERRIKNIPATNPSYISMPPETLGQMLSSSLIRRIAEEAIEECEKDKT